jgi:hypothetical protein
MGVDLTTARKLRTIVCDCIVLIDNAGLLTADRCGAYDRRSFDVVERSWKFIVCLPALLPVLDYWKTRSQYQAFHEEVLSSPLPLFFARTSIGSRPGDCFLHSRLQPRGCSISGIGLASLPVIFQSFGEDLQRKLTLPI